MATGGLEQCPYHGAAFLASFRLQEFGINKNDLARKLKGVRD